MSDHENDSPRSGQRRESLGRDHERIEADPRTHPSTDQPLNAAPRRNVGAAFAVLGVIGVILLVFLLLTVVRYAT